jgi:hypothetical protein
LFTAAVTLTISYDTDFRQQLINYTQEANNLIYIIVIIVLGAIAVA